MAAAADQVGAVDRRAAQEELEHHMSFSVLSFFVFCLHCLEHHRSSALEHAWKQFLGH